MGKKADFVAVPAPAKRVKGQAPELVLRAEPRVDKAPMGRPTSYTDEMADKICEHLARGGALYKFCEVPGHPGVRTVYQWIDRFPHFAQSYARAREEQQDFFAEEIIEIAKDETIAPDRARLRIDAQKWLAGKLAPKKYGERNRTEITGADGGPVKVQTNQIDVSGLSVEELEVFESALRKTLESKV